MDKITFTDGVTKLNKATMDTFQNNIDDGKVDKVTGKGLSTNDYTTEEKTKLSGIETGANKTVINNTLTSTSTTQAASANMVKTLSDTIGEIIESGSNANGEYIKFSNGKMICTKMITLQVNCNNSWGVLYENSDGANLGSWSQTFTNLDFVNIIKLGGRGSWIQTHNNPTVSSIGEVYITSATSWNSDVQFSCLGIGSWK